MAIPGERFYKMSNAIFCYGLTPVQMSVYSYLVCCTGQKEKCWPSMKTIAANCGCCENTARSAVDELERRGFISRVHTFVSVGDISRQTNNTYYIHELPPLPSSVGKTVTYEERPRNE